MRTNEERLDSLEREQRHLSALFLQIAEGSEGWMKPREAMDLLGCKQRTLSRLRVPPVDKETGKPTGEPAILEAVCLPSLRNPMKGRWMYSRRSVLRLRAQRLGDASVANLSPSEWQRREEARTFHRKQRKDAGLSKELIEARIYE
nr:MAG TPA: putative excisionase [Caudoviricetes sp.]